MYGLIGNFTAQPGKRDELIALMAASTGNMPGCLSYIVAKDPADPDKIWVTEVWDNAESHKASLQIPLVAETIRKAMPLIAGFGDQITTEPVGGVGLQSA
jgi:quinol monooxygenase YgiN